MPNMDHTLSQINNLRADSVMYRRASAPDKALTKAPAELGYYGAGGRLDIRDLRMHRLCCRPSMTFHHGFLRWSA